MTTIELQSALVSARAAYSQLMSGNKVASASYSQGEGSQTVSYRQTDVGTLTAYIRLLQAQLGIAGTSRRPVRFNFR
jgi:hypothetical protein